MVSKSKSKIEGNINFESVIFLQLNRVMVACSNATTNDRQSIREYESSVRGLVRLVKTDFDGSLEEKKAEGLRWDRPSELEQIRELIDKNLDDVMGVLRDNNMTFRSGRFDVWELKDEEKSAE